MLKSKISSQNLSAFAMDMEFDLEQCGMFKAKCQKTGDQTSALVVLCTLDQGVDIDEAMKAIQFQWQEVPIGYGGEKEFFRPLASTSSDLREASFVADGGPNMIVTGRLELRV